MEKLIAVEVTFERRDSIWGSKKTKRAQLKNRLSVYRQVRRQNIVVLWKKKEYRFLKNM